MLGKEVIVPLVAEAFGSATCQKSITIYVTGRILAHMHQRVIFVCLSVSLSVSLSVCLFVCLPVCVSLLSVADCENGGLLALQRGINLNWTTIYIPLICYCLEILPCARE